jgi:hypothetical protein
LNLNIVMQIGLVSLYGSWISFHLNEAAALWRRCEFGWSNLLALQFVSGVA